MTPGLLARVIAISGHDGVGKSTLAEALVHALPGPVFRIALADALKEDTARHLRLPLSVVRAKPTASHLRDYMRALGWAMRQEHGMDHWLREWADRAQDARRHEWAWVIVDDVRHLNEFAFMTNGDAFMVTLQRDGTDPENALEHPLPIVREVNGVRELNVARLRVAHDRGGYIPAAHVAGQWTTEDALAVIMDALRAVGRV